MKDTTTGNPNDSGQFYTQDMLAKYLQAEVAEGLGQMIEDIKHPEQVVAAVVFEDKTVGTRLGYR